MVLGVKSVKTPFQEVARDQKRAGHTKNPMKPMKPNGKPTSKAGPSAPDSRALRFGRMAKP